MTQRVLCEMLVGVSLFILPALISAQTGNQATQSWRLASPAYDLSFPRDHAAHPDYRIAVSYTHLTLPTIPLV